MIKNVRPNCLSGISVGGIYIVLVAVPDEQDEYLAKLAVNDVLAVKV